MNTTFNSKSIEVLRQDRDCYATDKDDYRAELKFVPAGGYAPKRTHFVARVYANGSVNAIDKSLEKEVMDWVKIEEFCLRAANAAENGGYCHGNGADFIFVENGHLVHVNFVDKREKIYDKDDEFAIKYMQSTRPHTVPETAESLRNYAASKLHLEQI